MEKIVTSSKSVILPEQELVEKKLSFLLINCNKSTICSSIFPFLLKSTPDNAVFFC